MSENKWDVSGRRWEVSTDGYTVLAKPEDGKPIRIVARCQTVIIATSIAESHNATLEDDGEGVWVGNSMDVKWAALRELQNQVDELRERMDAKESQRLEELGNKLHESLTGFRMDGTEASDQESSILDEHSD